MPPHERATDPMVPVAARIPESQRRQLRAIQALKGYSDLSDVIREAVSRYIDDNADLFRAAA